MKTDPSRENPRRHNAWRREIALLTSGAAVCLAVVASSVAGAGDSSTQGRYRAAVAGDSPLLVVSLRQGRAANARVLQVTRRTGRTIARARVGGGRATLELWARPVRARTAGERVTAQRGGQLELGWGVTRLRFKSRLRGRGWTHIAVTWTDDRAELYLDGRLSESHSYGPSAGRSLLHTLDLGASQPDEVALFARTLTVRTVNDHFRAGRAYYGRTPAPSAGTRRAFAKASTGGPTNTALPTISGTMRDGQTLTSTNGTWTGTGSITYARQWRRCDSAGSNCTDIAGATATTYTLTSADVASRMRVVVTATDTVGSTSATSSPTAAIAAAPPANTGVPMVSGAAREGQLLTSTTGTWTGTPTITFARQWQRCNSSGGSCSAISGATGVTYRLVAADVSKRIRVAVTATNSAGSANATSAVTVAVTTGPPVNTAPPTVSGNARHGQTLTSTTGTWAGTATITYARQWRRCDTAGQNCASITGATGAGYTLTASDVGSTVLVRVTASNSAGASIQDSSPTAVVTPDPPANTLPPTISGTARDGQTLSSAAGTWTGTPTPTLTRQWRRCDSGGLNCADIGGAMASSYTLTAADVGSTIRVTVTGTNTAGAASASSSPTAVVAAIPPANTALPSISGTPQEGRLLTVAAGTWTGTEPIAFAREWQRCDSAGASCLPISGETSPTYRLAAADVGRRIKVAVSGTNPAGTATAVASPTALVTTGPPVNEDLPSLSGSARDGQTLTSTDGEWAGTAPISYSTQWYRCNAQGQLCEPVPGGNSYVLSAADIGRTMLVDVTASNSEGWAIATSPVSDVVTASAPTNVSPPTLAGQAEVGSTLTTAAGEWTGTTPLSYAYQWRRCDASGQECVDIAGQTSTAYALTSADAGHVVRAAVTASNGAGTDTATTDGSAVVVVPLPTNQRLPAVSGRPTQGDTLSGDAGVWDGPGPIAYAYQWRRCDSQGDNCADIADALGSTYEPVQADVGAKLRLTVTASNAGGSRSASSAATAVVSPAEPRLTTGVRVVGQVKDGSLVYANVGQLTGVSPITTTFQWQRCDGTGGGCVDIAGANGQAYVPGHGEVGSALKVAVSVTNSAGSSSAMSAATTAVAPLQPYQSYQDAVAADAPVAHYRLEDADGAAVLRDSAGTRDAAVQGVSLAEAGAFNGSLAGSFAGVDRAELPSNPLATATAFTLEAWVNWDGSGLGQRVLDFRSSGTSYMWLSPSVAGSGSPARFEIAAPGAATAAVTAPRLSANTWHHVVVTAGNGALTLYVDGDQAGQTVGAVPTPAQIGATTHTWIGHTQAAGGTGLKGTLDEVAIYDHVLTASRVDAHHREGTRLTSISPPRVSPPTPDGVTVTGEVGTWSPGVKNYALQWQRCDAAGAGCTDIPGATSPIYTIGSQETGGTVRLEVEASDGQETRVVASKAVAPDSSKPGWLGSHTEAERRAIINFIWRMSPYASAANTSRLPYQDAAALADSAQLQNLYESLPRASAGRITDRLLGGMQLARLFPKMEHILGDYFWPPAFGEFDPFTPFDPPTDFRGSARAKIGWAGHSDPEKVYDFYIPHELPVAADCPAYRIRPGWSVFNPGPRIEFPRTVYTWGHEVESVYGSQCFSGRVLGEGDCNENPVPPDGMRVHSYFFSICTGLLPMEGDFSLPEDFNARTQVHERRAGDDPADFFGWVGIEPPPFNEAYDSLETWLNGPGGGNLREWLDDPSCETIVSNDDGSPDDPEPSAFPPVFHDRTVPPPGPWKWVGPEGSTPENGGEGNWHNPETKESWRYHPADDTHKPHWDYHTRHPDGNWRWYEDGTFEAKFAAACFEA